MKRYLIALGLTAAVAASAEAQRAEPVIDLTTAQAIVTGCLDHAAANGQGIAVAVFDQHGNIKAFARMDTATAAAGEIAMWKGKSAAKYGFATAVTATWGAPGPDMAIWRGGLPVRLESGGLIGGVGVSGAPSEFDEACGNKGIVAAGLPAAEIAE